MKARKLLCSAMAATLLLSAVPVATVYAETQVSEEYLAHSSVYAIYSVDSETGIVADIPLADLWDTDILEFKSYTKGHQISFVITSESGAFEDQTVKTLDITDYGMYTVKMGELRDSLPAGTALDDAQLKLVSEGNLPYFVRTADPEDDIYDHWYEESDGVYVFNSRSISGMPAFAYADFRIDMKEELGDKYVVNMTYFLDIEGTAKTYLVEDFENGETATGIFSTGGAFAGPVNLYNFDEICLMVDEIEPGATIRYYNIKHDYIDYAGEIDTSIAEDAVVKLVDSYEMPKNASADLYYGYDMSFLPEQAATITVTYEDADSNLTARTAKYNGAFNETTAISGSGEIEFDISISDMAQLRKDCLVLELDNTAKITDVEVKLIPNATLTEGEEIEVNEPLDSWNDFVYYEAEDFASYNTDTALILDVALSNASSDAAVQLRYGKTAMEQLSNATDVTNADSCSFDITGYLDEIKENGLYIYGNGVTIDTVSINQTEAAPIEVHKPEYAPAEATSADVANYTVMDDNYFHLNSDWYFENSINRGQAFSQKSDVFDGKYSQRFVQLISEEDSKTANSASIILYNYTKYIKVKTDTCSDTITIGNKEWTAPDGYVFVTATVTGIPTDVSLKYSDFILE